MKIGNLHIAWMSSRTEEMVGIELRKQLRSLETRESIARISRSEVKNYLAEVAERAEIPYIDAESLLARVEERARLLEAEAKALDEASETIRNRFSVADGERFL